MNIAAIGQAVTGGLSIVCATCRRYWEGRAKKLPEPQCTTTKACGSPCAGLDFPEYVGPITDKSRWCFVCGADSQVGVGVARGKAIIGVCDAHKSMVGELEPVGVDRRSKVWFVNNGRAVVENSSPTSGKSLWATIMEAEAKRRKNRAR